MTADELNRAAFLMEAALARLDIEPGHTTEAELAADDAEIMPALVDVQPVTTPGLTLATLTPGRYNRQWAGYITPVEVKKIGGRLVEITPRGINNPETMPDAVWITPQPNSGMSEGREI
jgi:hypothetical protein